MRRREFLKSGGAAAAAAAAASAGATASTAHTAPYVARGLHELRLAMPWADGFAGPADYARRLIRDIEARSEGRFRIVPSFGVADGFAAVQRGDADLYFSSEHRHVDAQPGVAFFAGLPGNHGLPPLHLKAWVDHGGGEPLWDALTADFDVKPLLAAHNGARSLLLASERIESMSALAHRKIHIGCLGREVARGLGLEPVDLLPAAVAQALSAGTILAAECGGAISAYALGLPAAAPHCAGTSINRHGTAVTLGVRRRWWEQLSSADQQIVRAAAAAEYSMSLAEEEAHHALLYPRPPADRIWPIASELSHAVDRVSDAVVAHLAGYDAATHGINASYSAFRTSYGGNAVVA